MMEPAPWERVLWRYRRRVGSWTRASYALTDLRLVVERRAADELPLSDVASVHLARTWIDRLTGRCTLLVRGAGDRRLALEGLTLAAALELVLLLLARDGCDCRLDPSVLPLAVEDPRRPARALRTTLAAAALVVSVALVAIRLHGSELPITYPPNDAIVPGGVKRDRAAVERFMEREVMPFAREALGPLVGGADRVKCETCHGEDGRRRGWRMPGVSELPLPRVRTGGLELYGQPADPQVRNAVYADLAQDDRQATAGYMRQVVMPGMARLLGRPAYDFTRSYRYNRQQFALGCYHCHRVR
jgi:hypothetical protein